jgi:hypothetical protein
MARRTKRVLTDEQWWRIAPVLPSPPALARGAKPMSPDWATGICDRRVEAGVPFFFKQWGGVNKNRTGWILDGRTWDEISVELELERGRRVGLAVV